MKTPPLPTLDDLESDLGHVLELLDIATDHIAEMFADKPLGGAMLNRHSALLWVSRDLLKGIAAQVERLQDNVAIRAAIRTSNEIGSTGK